MISPLDLRILGPVRVLIDGRPVPVGGPKARTVLAVLALQPRRAVSVATLADAVWDGRPPADEAGSLQVLVFNLRKKLRQNGVDGAAVVRTIAPGYSLEVPDEAVDRGRFDRLRHAAGRALAAGDDERAASDFRAALEEWQGDALADLRGRRFADEVAAALDEERWQTLAARIEADIACGFAANVISELVALVGENPLREPLWVQLVTALQLSGRQADALAACARLRGVLAEQLGIEPGRQMAELELRILRGEPVGPATASLPASKAPVAPTPRAAFTTTVTDAAGIPRRGRLRIDDGRVVEIDRDTVRIGRLPENEVTIDDPRASRYHAEIIVGRLGLILQDLESTNGVLLNDRPLPVRAFLADGDVVRIGAVSMRFEAG